MSDGLSYDHQPGAWTTLLLTLASSREALLTRNILWLDNFALAEIEWVAFVAAITEAV
jgi:hypothetical protein